ncbi:MAG: hypothetical protein L0271_08675 [Gemmatimonadetes bacterium]|nr:hypothetical protein [Gemmatimonadota bacterium]
MDETLTNTAEPHRQSANPQALLQDLEGQRQLARWRLHDAERSFRNALHSDSTFAMARHRLAQTLYWQLAQNPDLAPTLGPQVARESAAALRYAQGLTARDSLHLRAFYAFQEGDYGLARSQYRTLLEADSADVGAWLMLGSVEYMDPWLSQDSDTAAVPNSDLNMAIRAFAETLHLQPTFELGYGHLFDIHRQVMAATRGACPVFAPMTGDLIPPWETGVPRNVRTFCPVMMDSIVWLPRGSFDAAVEEEVMAGADRLFEQSLRLLRRWAEYSNTESKPLNELITQILWQRGRIDPALDTRADTLAREALGYAVKALSLTRDTVPQDLIRLGNLYLAVDSIERGREFVERGLLLHDSTTDQPGRGGPLFAANVLLATGQVSRALQLIERTGLRRAVLDSATGNLVPYRGAEPFLEQLRALGATQTGGPILRDRLQMLDQVWRAARYTARVQALLRRHEALRLAAALVLDPDALQQWNEGLELTEPLWQALVFSLTDTTRARAALAAARSRPASVLRDASQAFLEGTIAARLGDHELAVRSFSRVDGFPFAVDIVDVSWGLAWTARLRRAASHEALGNPSLALADYEAFARAWASADSLGAPLLAFARSRAAALRDSR